MNLPVVVAEAHIWEVVVDFFNEERLEASLKVIGTIPLVGVGHRDAWHVRVPFFFVHMYFPIY